MRGFFQSLPDVLAAKDFKEFIHLVQRAKESEKPILLAMGAHVVKTGLSPVFIDLMDKGWVQGLAMNGAGIIHDFEIAHSGQTSEDVEVQIKEGWFGMAEETGVMLNEAAREGAEQGIGLGEAVGKMIWERKLPHSQYSLLARAYALNIPVTVHVAVGTDITHFHPSVSGEDLGKTSLHDFFLFCSLVRELEGGGVFINFGSAVVLPEVFLKAVSMVRNKGYRLENFYTAVFDFIHHYRPFQNVVKRPIGKEGKGFYFIGHHELLIPLFAAGLKACKD